MLVNFHLLSRFGHVRPCSAQFYELQHIATQVDQDGSKSVSLEEIVARSCDTRHANFTMAFHRRFHLPRLYSWVVAASRSLVKLGQAAAKVWTLCVP